MTLFPPETLRMMAHNRRIVAKVFEAAARRAKDAATAIEFQKGAAIFLRQAEAYEAQAS